MQKGKRQNILGKQRIGFDIGESSVKMVLVAGTEIKNAVTADLPDHMVENGSILSMDAMADFIRTQANTHHLPKAEAAVILPASWKNILLSMVLAIGRAMGETMAVMMVMGNANLFPTLLGKGESIAAVIALEMGTAVVGSTHYHALYAAGLVLMVLLFVINVGITLLRDRLLRREGGGK